MKLTPKQRLALAKLTSGPCSPFDFGSTTVNRLRKAGLIATNPDRKIEITDTGRAHLAGYASGRDDANGGRWPQTVVRLAGFGEHTPEVAAYRGGYRAGYDSEI